MMNKNQVEASFKADLRALLKKWNTELEADDHFPGYPETGPDIRMTVTIPAIYDSEGDTEREWTEVDLGGYFS